MSLVPKIFGKFPKNKQRIKKIKKSQYYYLGRFHNENAFAPIPYWQVFKMLPGLLFGDKRKREPQRSLPVAYEHWDTSDGKKFWWSWLGHSSLAINIDEVSIIIDPVLSERVSPFKFMGPKRFHPFPDQIFDLKKIDCMIVSHDHYDHLDYNLIKKIHHRVKHFLVPLGIGEHLEFWGVDPKKIIELDWWETKQIGKVKFVLTPAQHTSGRWTGADNQTFWGSWVIEGQEKKLFYSGDSGFFKEWAEIGDHYGPFDVTFIQSAAYNRLWKYHHMTPTEVIEAHKLVRGKLLVPVHWSTFDLAVHRWYEPVIELKHLARAKDVRIMFPMLGKQNFVSRVSSEPYWWEDYLPKKTLTK
ncbi:MAG: MBL fold metallo-hydrolase [Candidatus Doudnabacteria bacterium]